MVLFHNPPSMTMGAIGAGAIYMSVDMSKSFAIERGERERRRWRHRDISICNLPSIARNSHRRCQESRHQRHHSRKRSLTLSLYIYIYIRYTRILYRKSLRLESQSSSSSSSGGFWLATVGFASIGHQFHRIHPHPCVYKYDIHTEDGSNP